MIKNFSVTNFTSYKIKKAEIHNFINSLKNEIDFRVQSLVINFLTSDQIIPINKEYLNHDYSTDIITFNYSGENYTLDGEIFISLDDASFNANKYGVSLKNEIIRLIIHGILHLKGYDDQSPDNKKKMKKVENRLVKKFFNSLNKIN